MSVYSEMLRMAWQEDEDSYGSVSDLVSHILLCRARLGGGGDAATRLARSLAYDVALIRLCERMDLRHDMFGSTAAPVAREETERMLASRLPPLAAALEDA